MTPYHDYTRPPPSAVLAEAAKNTEQKTGLTLKGLEIPSDAASNGQAKKDEEPPVVVDPPALITKYFDGIQPPDAHLVQPSNTLCLTDMTQRFKNAQEGKLFPHELLHIVTLTQEVGFP